MDRSHRRGSIVVDRVCVDVPANVMGDMDIALHDVRSMRYMIVSPSQKSNVFYREESSFDEMLIGHQHSFYNQCRMQMLNSKI